MWRRAVEVMQARHVWADMQVRPYEAWNTFSTAPS